MVDGTLVLLDERPFWYGESYFDWKCNYSLNVQVCFPSKYSFACILRIRLSLFPTCTSSMLVMATPVTTEHRVRIGDTYKTSRSADECLCSESGARLDGQGWRQGVY